MRTLALLVGLMVLEACGGSPDQGGGFAAEESTSAAGDASSSSSRSSASTSSSSSTSTTTSSSTSTTPIGPPVTSVTCGGMTIDCLTGDYTTNVGLSGTGAYAMFVAGAKSYWCNGVAAATACPTGSPCTIWERGADGGPNTTVGTFLCNE